MRKLFLSLTLVIIAAVVTAQPSLAQNNNFKIFAGAAYVSPLDDSDIDLGVIEESVEASDELGFTIGFEWRMIELIGLEIDVIAAKHDLEFDGDAFAEVDFTPISATLNFHLINTKLIDLYLGPTATYVVWGDVEFDSDFGLDDGDADNEFAYGASVGLDIGLGDHFAIFGGLRWLSLDIENDDLDAEIGVDPLISRVGVAYRF